MNVPQDFSWSMTKLNLGPQRFTSFCLLSKIDIYVGKFIACSELKIFVYHFSIMTRVSLSPEKVARTQCDRSLFNIPK